MRIELLNGSSPINGTNSSLPMNGTNASFPMNGTNASVPMQGSNGMIYYVAPISLLDIDDVPTDWIPTGLTPEDILYLKTAYMMGDPSALNGKLGDALKRVAQQVGNAIPVAARAVTSAVSSVIPGGKALVAASEANAQKFQNQVANAIAQAENAIAMKAAESVTTPNPAERQSSSRKIQEEANRLASETITDLTNMGINPNPEVIADRALMAADAGVRSGSSNGGIIDRIKNWWGSATTGEKVFAGFATAALLYGGYKGVEYLASDNKTKKKGGKK